MTGGGLWGRREMTSPQMSSPGNEGAGGPAPPGAGEGGGAPLSLSGRAPRRQRPDGAPHLAVQPPIRTVAGCRRGTSLSPEDDVQPGVPTPTCTTRIVWLGSGQNMFEIVLMPEAVADLRRFHANAGSALRGA